MTEKTDDSHQPIRADRCPECRALVHDGQAACQALWDALAIQSFTDLRLAAVRDLAFDAYCMQHIEPYCHSAKSYAAHLTRLCCGVEHGGNAVIYAAINSWLNGQRTIEKPSVLDQRGTMTIADICTTPAGNEQLQRIHDWVKGVWAAYAEQQHLARTWIEAALNTHNRRRR